MDARSGSDWGSIDKEVQYGRCARLFSEETWDVRRSLWYQTGRGDFSTLSGQEDAVQWCTEGSSISRYLARRADGEDGRDSPHLCQDIWSACSILIWHGTRRCTCSGLCLFSCEARMSIVSPQKEGEQPSVATRSLKVELCGCLSPTIAVHHRKMANKDLNLPPSGAGGGRGGMYQNY